MDRRGIRVPRTPNGRGMKAAAAGIGRGCLRQWAPRVPSSGPPSKRVGLTDGDAAGRWLTATRPARGPRSNVVGWGRVEAKTMLRDPSFGPPSKRTAGDSAWEIVLAPRDPSFGPPSQRTAGDSAWETVLAPRDPSFGPPSKRTAGDSTWERAVSPRVPSFGPPSNRPCGPIGRATESWEALRDGPVSSDTRA